MQALVRRPSPRLAEGIVSHVPRRPIDLDLAMAQWRNYVRVFKAHGWTTTEVPPADDCPDGVFIEDAAVAFGELGVVTRPGEPTRRAEVDTVEHVLAALVSEVEHIRAPGTLEGGDVLKTGSTVYVGESARTNAEGIRQLQAMLEGRGQRVVAVPVRQVLHLKSAVTALPDGTVIGWPAAVEDASVFSSFHAVPEEAGAHVVLLGGDRLLMAEGAPRSAELFSSLGYEPVQLDISEFTKLDGCVTCLSVRLRDAPAG